ncbi:helix-turn-helix domain-containing protein [Paramuribaculum intestinale]|uniref:helix-turn-helix domain-containing protein n=1 Tax=Paramuribaculum intestinale TaxID=2094151 RepID=UPI0025A610D9|nr:helix-turn-helix domain-containing protein [Paramuribaculum intestinale]
MIDNEKSITETLNQILLLLQSQEERIAALCSSPLYDNKALMALLGIKDRCLKRFRDNGLLGYSRHGDKYWYTQADVDRFLARCHYAPFNDH